MATIGLSQTDSPIAALYTGFGFCLFATIVFSGVGAMKSGKAATVANLATITVASSALAYLIEALGATTIVGNNGVNQLQWLRYAQWAFNTPLLVATLGYLVGSTASELFFTTTFSWIVTGALFAAAVSQGLNATWPIFAFGVVSALPIILTVFSTWAGRAASAPAATSNIFNILKYFGLVLAIGYTIVWGTAEGGHAQQYFQEIIVYTVFDILSRVVFGFVLLFAPGAAEGAVGVISAGAAPVKAAEASAAAPAAV